MFRSFTLVVTLILMSGASIVHAQHAAGQEVVVEGERLPDEKAPPPPGIKKQGNTLAVAQVDDQSKIFQRCVKFTPTDTLRQVVDGRPNSPQHEYSLDRFIRINVACYPGAQQPPPESPGYSYCRAVIGNDRLPICRSYYDRGAIIEGAVAHFAPDATLTMAEVADKEVQKRLDAREATRLALALPADKARMQIAECLVMSQPEQVTKMFQARDTPALQVQYVYRIMDRGKVCLGGIKSARVEPLYFRYVLTEAFYRWVVAARNVDTLIPA
ncbi:hypothetical protein NZL82_08545 [Sphingomonas sanguinis]|nr:hypothetical protein [Sphingomonas sp. LC-1]